MVETLKKYQFLFEELVKRDFKKKYKRTVLGMGWSILSPLLMLLVLYLVFGSFFGRYTEHYTIYLFSGNLLYSYFNDSTTGGMRSLLSNAHIFTKVTVPKYMFLLARSVQSLINFGLSLVVYFIFVIFDDVSFHWGFIMLIYPIVCITVFNIGFGLILSILYVFFRDMDYLYGIFTMVVMYGSAIFYTITHFDPMFQKLFYLNPVFVYITYFREIVVNGIIPSIGLHLLCFFYAFAAMVIGCWMYKKYNQQILYYV